MLRTASSPRTSGPRLAPTLDELDAELEETLDELKKTDPAALAEAMLASMYMDGCLTALAVAPDPVLLDAWAEQLASPKGWTGDEKDALKLEVVRMRFDSIVSGLAEKPPSYDPLLPDGDGVGMLGAAWCEGFKEGMALRGDAWMPLVEAPSSAPLFGPIVTFHAAWEGEPGAEDGEVYAAARAALPAAVLALRAELRSRRPRPFTHRVIGRDEPRLL